MSIQHALDFIRHVEDRPALKAAIERAAADQGLAGLVRIGADLQLSFDERELRRAFAIDWSMRVCRAAAR